jgi:hypothetical protein
MEGNCGGLIEVYYPDICLEGLRKMKENLWTVNVDRRS